MLGVLNKSSVISFKFFKHIHLKKKLTFCSIHLLFFISVIFGPFAMFLLYSFSCKCFVFNVTLIKESVKMGNFAFFLCLLSHLTPSFGNSSTSFGERLSLLCAKIPYTIGVLANEQRSLSLEVLFHRCKR